MLVKYIKNIQGNQVLPITHVSAVRDNQGNTLTTLLAAKANSSDVPAAQIQSDWDQTDNTAKDYIKNKPTIPTIPTNVSTFTNDAGYLTSHQDISGKANTADLATVATTGSYNDLTDTPTIPTVPTLATVATSGLYKDVSYTVATQSKSGALTIDGSKPIHVVTATGNITSVTLSTNPAAGHSTHVIIFSTAARTVAVAHHATSRVCPGAANLSLSIPANGYVELDFLNANSKIYVRGV